jgi:histidinol dehydrogenase
MVTRINAADTDFAEAWAALIAERGERLDQAEDVARKIAHAVRLKGLEAVLTFTAEFDGIRLAPDELRVVPSEVDAAVAACSKEVLQALETAAARIRTFHTLLRPTDHRYTDAEGMSLGWRWTPVDAAGLYAPGGLAAYPSAVLMNAIPAKVAGVKRLVMATPPGKLFENPAILAAARIAGVDEIWRIGGAQAIAALAYGAGPIAPVDVIVGPGNAYVAAAKKVVFGDVGIDSIAGPSEVFIVADAAANPSWIAADLLAQAEHDPQSQSILFTADAAFADAVEAAVTSMLAANQAGAAAAESWRNHGAIIIVPDPLAAVPLIDKAAPEHLQIALADPEPLAAAVRHAGAIFLGVHTPEALGDYVAGPNHVLPTGRRARFSSGLATATFMKRTTIMGADAAALAAIGPQAACLARAEGLPAHAHSIAMRLADG